MGTKFNVEITKGGKINQNHFHKEIEFRLFFQIVYFNENKTEGNHCYSEECNS